MEVVTKDSTKPQETAHDLMVAKVVAMCVLGLASFVVGVAPIKLTKLVTIRSVKGDKNLLVSLLLCFGGGVLLFTTFIHLQPEVRDSFAALHHKLPPIGASIPLSELVFCSGFFFVYLVEETVHFFLHRRHRGDVLHRTLSRRCNTTQRLTIPRVTLTKFDDGNISCISNSNRELLNSQTNVEGEKHRHDYSSFGGLLAVLALSFHAVFEGLAVGLEGSVQNVWYLFTAIATHKLVIAFCVGVELVMGKTKTLLTVLYVGTFAVVTPLGIGIGVVLSESANAREDVASAVLQAMAAGTLLYVVFFEVLARERENRHSGIWQLLAILAGFGVMLCLQMLTGHSHDHGGHHSHTSSEHPQASSHHYH